MGKYLAWNGGIVTDIFSMKPSFLYPCQTVLSSSIICEKNLTVHFVPTKFAFDFRGTKNLHGKKLTFFRRSEVSSSQVIFSTFHDIDISPKKTLKICRGPTAICLLFACWQNDLWQAGKLHLFELNDNQFLYFILIYFLNGNISTPKIFYNRRLYFCPEKQKNLHLGLWFFQALKLPI